MIDLFKAAYANDVAKVMAAISEGQDPNAQHPRAGTIPLQLACQGNAIDSIRALLAAGADPNRQFTRTSRVDGRVFADHSPLMYASSVEAAGLLLDAGARLDMTDSDGVTPLICAVYGGNPELFAFLLEQGASVEDAVVDGRTMALIEFVDAHRSHVLEMSGSSPNFAAAKLLDSLSKIREILVVRAKTVPE